MKSTATDTDCAQETTAVQPDIADLSLISLYLYQTHTITPNRINHISDGLSAKRMSRPSETKVKV
ncbi:MULTISPECIES: hypothetical protein [unclassified Neisseria]|uniref:hypothetical protein n=1 Tax=unclassified Neisseria TaxID=2623750 RepID=UPI0026652D4F|nr:MULTISPECIES: hypothetical protein [unclassified Neisseria]MDO1510581.1 hypothetical protein [Neisseria sp. MVDL19-042950]MDO1516295.1 hypothetical protein [Neisseria sp. MVDL18-041461]MDO1564233.1 hypothetical protein [Neisseria sp. MVDL20-010259]